jgi:hypothetical protein
MKFRKISVVQDSGSDQHPPGPQGYAKQWIPPNVMDSIVKGSILWVFFREAKIPFFCVKD